MTTLITLLKAAGKYYTIDDFIFSAEHGFKDIILVDYYRLYADEHDIEGSDCNLPEN